MHGRAGQGRAVGTLHRRQAVRPARHAKGPAEHYCRLWAVPRFSHTTLYAVMYSFTLCPFVCMLCTILPACLWASLSWHVAHPPPHTTPIPTAAQPAAQCAVPPILPVAPPRYPLYRPIQHQICTLPLILTGPIATGGLPATHQSHTYQSPPPPALNVLPPRTNLYTTSACS